MVSESTRQVEACEGRAEWRWRRRRFSSGGGNGTLWCSWSSQRCHGTTHRLGHQDRSADTSARKSSGGPVASSSPGEVREGTARETDAAHGRWRLLGNGTVVERRSGTGELVGESDRSGATTLGCRHGDGDRRRGWPKSLRGASAPDRSRVLRKVVNIVDDEHAYPVRRGVRRERLEVD